MRFLRTGLIALLLLCNSAIAATPTIIQWQRLTLRLVYDPGPQFYCYAACGVEEHGIDHVFACRNELPLTIRDHIYRFDLTATTRPIVPTLALAPGDSDAWDGYHVCDPSVIAGRFRFGGNLYRYAMFYLGNDVDASKDNQIGVAFASEITGPWHRSAQPVVAFTPTGAWGVGQPSAINLDHESRILLFYTRGNHGARGCVREMNLADMDHPQIGAEIVLSKTGLLRTDGRPDYLNNFDVVLDESRRRFLVVREQRPYPRTNPSHIGASLEIASIPIADLRTPDARWSIAGHITPELTGFPRNHNAGFIRTPFGALPDRDQLRIIFATSAAAPKANDRPPLWTYALHEITGKIMPLKD